MGGKLRIGVVVVLCFSWFLVASSANYTNILRQGAPLRFGEQLVSSNQLFSLGFGFPYGNADYGSIVCINWGLSTGSWPPLWVGNPDSPILEGSVGLSLGSYGELMVTIDHMLASDALLLYGGEADPLNASAILQDNGNFVIHELNSDGSVKRILWQSFDHPTDALLPGMRLGINNNLTSGAFGYSNETGSFTFGMNPNGAKELIIWRQDYVVWRSGIWQQNSLQVQYHAQNYGIFYYNFSFIQIGNKTFFTYTVNSSGTSFISLNLGTRGSLVQVSRLVSIGNLVSCSQHYEADFLSTANGGCTTLIELVARDDVLQGWRSATVGCFLSFVCLQNKTRRGTPG